MDIATKNYFDDESNNSSLEFFRDALFGDGFFTTAVVRDGHIVNKERHLARLEESAKRLKFNQWNETELGLGLEQITTKYPDSILRISCSRKQRERGYAFNSNSKIQCDITIQKLIEFSHKNCQLKIAKTPISVNKMLAGIKHLNRLDNVMASSECEAPNQEALMCDEERVICGSRSNLFIKLDGEWLTPTISDCGINGITQSLVIEKMNDIGVKCRRENIYKADLKKMSASFITNSLVGILPAISFKNVELDIDLALDLDCVSLLKNKLDLTL
jgi:4-amino-4-deoxychorismate lyase